MGALVQTVGTFGEFYRIITSHGDQWTHEGAYALFEYLGELAESCDENIEIEAVGIRCDFSEIDLDEVFQFMDLPEPETDEEREEFADSPEDYLRARVETAGNPYWLDDAVIAFLDNGKLLVRNT